MLGKCEPMTACVELSEKPNLAAADPVEINVYLANPQSYEIIITDETGPRFSILDSNGDEVATQKTATLSSDKTTITLRAKLTDTTEKENLTLTGSYDIIKGGAVFDGDAYSYSFKQNTPPDDPRSLRNQENAEVDEYHCLHFTYPDQS